MALMGEDVKDELWPFVRRALQTCPLSVQQRWKIDPTEAVSRMRKRLVRPALHPVGQPMLAMSAEEPSRRASVPFLLVTPPTSHRRASSDAMQSFTPKRRDDAKTPLHAIADASPARPMRNSSRIERRRAAEAVRTACIQRVRGHRRSLSWPRFRSADRAPIARPSSVGGLHRRRYSDDAQARSSASPPLSYRSASTRLAAMHRLPSAPLLSISPPSSQREEERDVQRRPSTESSEDVGPFEPSEDVTVTWLQPEERLRMSLEPGDEVLFHCNCFRVDGLEEAGGVFLLCKEHIYLASGFSIGATGELVEEAPVGEGDGDPGVRVMLESSLRLQGAGQPAPRVRRWLYSDVAECHKRRYLLRHSGLEFFFADGTNILLVFNVRQRDAEVCQRRRTAASPRQSLTLLQVYKRLMQLCPSLRQLQKQARRRLASSDSPLLTAVLARAP